MAAVGFEEVSAPPGSELALPPLFGGHILESELETEVEFVSGGLGGSGLRERDEEEEAARGRRRRQRELNRRKYQALGRRCREIEQVGECGSPSLGLLWPELVILPSVCLSRYPAFLAQVNEPSVYSFIHYLAPRVCPAPCKAPWRAVSSRSFI